MTPPAAPRRALLVGVQRYQHHPTPADLRGPCNDVALVRALLVERFAFADADLCVLLDEDATRDAIVDAFERHLIGGARPDGVAVFLFAGHGSRVRAGEADPTFVETLVPHDSGRAPHPNRDLRDDELRGLLSRLAKRSGRVTVILDSCHAGGATRGRARARSIDADPRPPAASGAPPRLSARGAAATAGEHTLLAACAADEVAFEDDYPSGCHGVLSWELCRAVREAGRAASYRDVMDRLRMAVTARMPGQHPRLAGARPDDTVFGAPSLAPPAHVLVEPIGRDAVSLRCGGAHGATVGSEYAVYPAGSAIDGETPITTARIERVEPTRAHAVLEPPAAVPAAARAVETRHAFAGFRLPVWVAGDGDELAAVRRWLAEYDHVEVTEIGPRLVVRAHGGMLWLEGADGSPMGDPVPPTGSSPAESIARQVLAWARWHNLAAIAQPPDELGLSLRLVAPTPDPPVVGATLDAAVRDGDHFALEIGNRGRRAFYASVIDLASDGSVSVHPDDGRGGLRVEAGATRTLRYEAWIAAGESVRDVYKVVATADEVAFDCVTQAPVLRSAQPRAAGHPLRELFAHAASGRRSLVPLAAPPAAWATAEVALEVWRRA